MTEENKQLLLIDLCGRLPHGVKIHIDSEFLRAKGLDVQTLIGVDLSLMVVIAEHDSYKSQKIKPYLRPMTSMSAEERNEYLVVCTQMLNNSEFYAYQKTPHLPVDWLNEHHLDYRGLIEKGLALEAPEGMYEIN